MPKMKTNRLARKKFRVNASGKISHARAYTSHKTGKRSAKRNRQLKGCILVDDTNYDAIARLMPYD